MEHVKLKFMDDHEDDISVSYSELDELTRVVKEAGAALLRVYIKL